MAKISNFEEFKLYNDSVKILFYPDSHQYWLIGEDGKKKRLCGVTSYLSMIDKSNALVPWAVNITVDYIRNNIAMLQNNPSELLRLAKEESNNQKDQAAELGKAIHLWISEHIKGNNPEMPDDDQVKKGVESFIDWVIAHKVKFIDSERVVYSKNHGFVGTLDMIIEIDGKKYLGDIKTGNAIYDEAKAQTAAYLHAYNEEFNENFDGRMILRISKETESEYVARMEKKGKTDYPKYQVFEPVFLENESFATDLNAFLSAMNIYRWKQGK